MRKPLDYDSELKTLDAKARALKAKHVRQLGELVIACGADALDIEILAGGLLAIATANEPARKESWRKRGEEFFRSSPRSAARGPQSRARSASPNNSGAQPTAGETSAS